MTARYDDVWHPKSRPTEPPIRGDTPRHFAVHPEDCDHPVESRVTAWVIVEHPDGTRSRTRGPHQRVASCHECGAWIDQQGQWWSCPQPTVRELHLAHVHALTPEILELGSDAYPDDRTAAGPGFRQTNMGVPEGLLEIVYPAPGDDTSRQVNE